MFDPDRGLAAESGAAALKAMPPVAVSAGGVAGLGLQDWVFILTLVYLALQIGLLVWKLFRKKGLADER